VLPEISLNILDVAENSVRAEANTIEINLRIQTEQDCLTVQIIDNGCGMTRSQLEQVQDPFFTTRTTRKVGLGIPFFKQAALATGGVFRIDSKVGEGTIVEATFVLSHIDCMPLGDITATIYTLVVFNENIHIRYTYQYNDKQFTLDTREIREIVGEDISFQELAISQFIQEFLESNKAEAENAAR